MERIDYEETEILFQKKFSFESNDKFILPSVENCFSENQWEIDCFLSLKNELNNTKSLLNDKEIKEWRKHTTYTNHASSVVNKVRCEINPELLTQAWLKFYEIVSSYPLVPSNVASFSSFHLCEAPGAFIAALNHYISCKKRRIKWKWMANTLNPYYEGNCRGIAIMDDRFLNQTLPNWYFGTDNTGNLLNPKYLSDLLHFLNIEMNINESPNLVDLVTADGSFDCQENPAEQENLVLTLKFAEMVTALHILKTGGSFIFKIFTTFECNSICIIYFLNCVFHEVNLFKPATSKSGNSEVYVVCLKYKGRTVISSILEMLKNKIGSQLSQKALFSLDVINKDFIRQLFNCCNQFKTYQESTIRENLHLFENMSQEECLHLNFIKEVCAQLYLEKYELRQIKKSQKIMHRNGFKRQQFSSRRFNSFDIIQKTERSGSFNSRQEENTESKHQLITKQLAEWFSFPDAYNEISYIKLELSSIEPCSSWIRTGISYSYITNSKFCFPHLLSMWVEFGRKSQMINNNISKQERYNWHHILDHDTYNSKYIFSNADIIINMCKTHYSSLEELKTVLPSVNIISYVENTEYSQASKLVYFDPFCCSSCLSPLREEIDIKPYLIEKCVKIISILNENDCLVLCLHSSLTRVTVGILYLLSHMFFELFVLSPKIYADVSSSQLWFFSKSHLKYRDKILKHMNDTKQIMETKSFSKETVLEVVPIEYLCEEPFYTFILEANQTFLTRKLNQVLSEKVY